jgi:chitin deacetylase
MSSLAQAGLACGLLLLVSLICSVHAAVIPSRDLHVHDHVSQSLLPDRWYHDDQHPARALFKRQAAAPAAPPAVPQVGSLAWTAAYPAGIPDANAMPQAWKDALNNAVQAGKIPNIPPSVITPGAALPTYGNLNPTSPNVCSGAYACRVPGQIWDAPPGVIGIGFDDGPLPVSFTLTPSPRHRRYRCPPFSSVNLSEI